MPAKSHSAGIYLNVTPGYTRDYCGGFSKNAQKERSFVLSAKNDVRLRPTVTHGQYIPFST